MNQTILSSLSLVSSAQTFSLSPENPDGKTGGGGRAEAKQDSPARELGVGWKCRPNVQIDAGETLEIADLKGPGVVQHIWMTITGRARMSIIRVYYDGCETPAIECPYGDFFASPWTSRQNFAQISSLPVCVNPGSAMNCFWSMPFRSGFRMTLENVGLEQVTLFYQIDGAYEEVPEEAGYLCAHFRRTNPVPYKEVYTLLDIAAPQGQYVGTVMGWGTNNQGWWGEGEVKFFIDEDEEFPTICGTGTEDYFLGSYNFENQATKQYQEFTTPHSGMPYVGRPDGLYNSQQRFALYRWHLADPIRFKNKLRVTCQILGWRQGGRYLPLQDDISSVAFWYQTGEASTPPVLPDRDQLEIM